MIGWINKSVAIAMKKIRYKPHLFAVSNVSLMHNFALLLFDIVPLISILTNDQQSTQEKLIIAGVTCCQNDPFMISPDLRLVD